MNTENTTEFSGLTAIAGVRCANFPSARSIGCPLCGASVALLAGKITLSAQISGDDLCDGPLPLAGFVCSRSHVFFLREQDALPGALAA